ncbi:MAG: thiol-disulfide oxidoreductase DCC family protein [Vicingaceae bacterium]
MPNSIPKNKKLILFDGVCNLCNGAVNFIIDRDPNKVFLFAPLQAEESKEILNTNPKASSHDLNEMNSILLIENEKIYQKSTAALRIAKSLSGLWPILYSFIIIPRFLRDPIYAFIAQNRYRWFGKKESCRLPTDDLKSRFLSYDEPS